METKHVTLKLEMDEFFSALQCFIHPVDNSVIIDLLPASNFFVALMYLNKTKNDFWRKVTKESTIVSHRDLFSILLLLRPGH